MNKSEAIRELRKQKGLTQQQLANELGLAVSSVARYEAGKPPEARVLAQLAIDAIGTGRNDLAKVFQAELAKDLKISEINNLGLIVYLHKLIILLKKENLRLYEPDLSNEERFEIAGSIAEISSIAIKAIQDTPPTSEAE
jgi:transcriptional regulator with XRE-family HTH domain